MVRTSLLSLAALLTLVTPAAPASAATFDVTPVTLAFSDKAASGTVVVTNRSQEVLRFQISAFRWGQRPDGEMTLEPTKDIVFFPAMLSLKPKESRQIRVGTKLKPGAVERTYRLFVEELPPLARNADEASNAVRVLTKMGLPIFVEAKSGAAKPSVSPLSVSGRELSFSLENGGNKHMRVQKIVVNAKNAGKTVHSHELAGWYVLAGGSRIYSVPLPDEACTKATSLEVQIESDSGSPKATLANFHCGS